MMSDEPNFMTVMKSLPVGSMMYDIVSISSMNNWEIAFFIKEDSKHLFLYKKPHIEIITGLIQEKNVMTVVVLLNVNNHEDLLYETWMNYYAELGELSFTCLSKQENITIYLLDENNNTVRSLSIENGLKSGISSFINIIKEKPNWSMEEFDQAKESIFEKYPRAHDLYNKLRDSIVL